MASVPVRIPKQQYDDLVVLSRTTGRSKQQIISDALKRYEREQRLRVMADSFNRGKQNPKKWAAYLKEVEQLTGLSTSRRGPAR